MRGRISHAGLYAIINPARRVNVPQEMAIVTPFVAMTSQSWGEGHGKQDF
jgi:hypothetical protein